MQNESFNDIQELIVNATDKMYLELIVELIDYSVIEEMLTEKFNWLEEKEQEELLQRFSKKLNGKEQTNG
jgi:hypothetical protein